MLVSVIGRRVPGGLSSRRCRARQTRRHDGLGLVAGKSALHGILDGHSESLLVIAILDEIGLVVSDVGAFMEALCRVDRTRRDGIERTLEELAVGCEFL